MIHSQLNIGYLDHTFNYYIESVQSTTTSTNEIGYKRTSNEEITFFNNKYTNQKYQNNSWYDTTYDSVNIISTKLSTFRLYFPLYSLETYLRNVFYNLTISTFINGRHIILGSYRINRDQVLASSRIVEYKSNRFQEYISFSIPDPWEICYGDDWSVFRINECEAPLDPQGNEINDEGSILLVELTPITLFEDRWNEREHISKGSCCISYRQDINDFLHLQISPNVEYDSSSDWQPNIKLKLEFNEVYEGDFDNYMMETYNIDISDYNSLYNLVIKDEDNIYKSLDSNSNANSVTFNKDEFNIQDWSEYKDGLFLVGSLTIIDQDEEEIMFIKSEEIPLTPLLYRYFIKTDINYIDTQNMEIKEINVVNKIDKTIININRPEDYKANILKPIFIRTGKLANTIFHPMVTESVCIDVNAYKSKVKTFFLRLEGVDFVEQGRTPSGVVFKVIGSSLPNIKPTGVFYILNEEKEMVISGNYNYIQ